MTTKRIVEIRKDVAPHWVGDGFPVRSLFAYHADATATSPFLLLDYAGPAEFPPSTRPRGVGEHPHRGFETVTIVYQGELEHRDSAGSHGTIGAGDVQWMTAASGVVHEEFHSQAFSATGGTLEMVQLWVNLRAADKTTAPHYQAILDAQIPAVALDDGAGTVRVIAGDFRGTKGPAKTFSPVNLWDMRLNAKGSLSLTLPDGYTTILLVQQGSVTIGGSTTVRGAGLVRFDRSGDRIDIACETDATVLVLCGEPIDEPVVGQGPFVMNTSAEIRQAILDYQGGRMGTLD